MLNNLVDCKKCLDFLNDDVNLLKIKIDNINNKLKRNKIREEYNKFCFEKGNKKC